VCHAIKALGGTRSQSKDQGKTIQHGIKKDIQKREAEPGEHRREENAREQKLQGMTDEQGGEKRAGPWSGNTKAKKKKGCREKRV
jgi:hypothetical protein